MYLPLLGLSFGLLTLRLMPFLPSYNLLITLGISALLLLFGQWYLDKRSYNNNNQSVFRLLRIAGYLYVLGFSYACFSAKLAVEDRLNTDLDGKVLWITGKITELPNIKEHSTSFIVRDATSTFYDLPNKIRVS